MSGVVTRNRLFYFQAFISLIFIGAALGLIFGSGDDDKKFGAGMLILATITGFWLPSPKRPYSQTEAKAKADAKSLANLISMEEGTLQKLRGLIQSSSLSSGFSTSDNNNLGGKLVGPEPLISGYQSRDNPVNFPNS